MEKVAAQAKRSIEAKQGEGQHLMATEEDKVEVFHQFCQNTMFAAAEILARGGRQDLTRAI
eukprot:5580945-Lingulodinium_polyedra.AAC.1